MPNTRDNPGEFGHYAGMTVAERKKADAKMAEAKRRAYVPSEGHTAVTETEHVTEEILEAARSIVDGWYNDGPIDWENVWERLDGSSLNDGSQIDLGPVVDSPAMRKIQRVIRAERKEG